MKRKGNVVARVIGNLKGKTLTEFVRETVSHKVSLLVRMKRPDTANSPKNIRFALPTMRAGSMSSVRSILRPSKASGRSLSAVSWKLPQSQQEIHASLCLIISIPLQQSGERRLMRRWLSASYDFLQDYNTAINALATRLIPLTQVACLVFSGFHAGLRSPQPAKDVVGGPQATAGFIDRQRGVVRWTRGDDSLSQGDKPLGKSRYRNFYTCIGCCDQQTGEAYQRRC